MKKNKPKRRRIAMIGTAPSSLDAPVNDKSWEFWGINGIERDPVYARIDRWYQIHNLAGEHGHAEWLDIMRLAGEKGADIWMFWLEESLPTARQYPIEEIAHEYGTFFMTSSMAWMMAHAIEEMRYLVEKGVECEIGVWGIDMEFGTEYYEQRDGMQHFIDLAKQLGIKVTMPVTVGLAHQPVAYPFWEAFPHLRKLMKHQECEKEINEKAERLARGYEVRIAALDFAMDELAAAGVDPKRIGELKAERSDMAEEHKTARDNAIGSGAVLKHIEWHLKYLKGCGG